MNKIYNSNDDQFTPVDSGHHQIDKSIYSIDSIELDERELKWHHRFMELARHISTWSKDSTKIGAVAITDKRRVISTAYNGIASKFYDRESRLRIKELKYLYTVHAEANLIYNSVIPLENSTVYVHGLPICPECAKALIQVNVATVVCRAETIRDCHDPWKTSWKISKRMFDEAKVKVILI